MRSGFVTGMGIATVAAVSLAVGVAGPGQRPGSPATPTTQTTLEARGALESREDADGIVYGWYNGVGYRFNPLLSFAHLNAHVSAGDEATVRSLASALVVRGRSAGKALLWEYDFPYHGGPTRWVSGFAQAVATQALARAGALLGEPALLRAAESAFRSLDATLLMPVGGGVWIREYGFTSEVILNAQLQTLVSLTSYARMVRTERARSLTRRLYAATRSLLPRFSLGHWSRYELGGPAATTHYHLYHVDLLGRLAVAYPDDAVWRDMRAAWSPPL